MEGGYSPIPARVLMKDAIAMDLEKFEKADGFYRRTFSG